MKKGILIILFLHIVINSFGQDPDSTKTPTVMSGVITATNNGISLLPNFSLNKPALLVDLSVGKGRLSFDPMFRFGMDGKPWTFVFWGRYKLITNKKFSMGIGAHPSFVFRELANTNSLTSSTNMITQRYLAWEASPTYVINKKLNIGVYYLGSHGLTDDLTQVTTFVAVKATLAHLALSKKVNVMLIPQWYYLKQDVQEGTYMNATLVLGMKNCPVSVSSIVSKAIHTEIAGKDFVWNVGLSYSFARGYLKK